MEGGAWWTAVHGVVKSRTQLSDFTFTFHFSLSCIGEGNGNPLQCSCLENLRDGGTWWAAVYGVPQSGTRLKRLSSRVIGNPDFSLSSFPPRLFTIVFGRHFVIPSVFFLTVFLGSDSLILYFRATILYLACYLPCFNLRSFFLL